MKDVVHGTGTHPALQHLGSTTNPEKYLKAAERLKDVSILWQDYEKTLAAYDSKDTFFFIDPPYPGEWFDKDKVIDLGEFIDALAKVEGKFIAVLNPTPENVAAFKKVGRVFRLKVREASGRGGAKHAMRLFVANFLVRKAEEVLLVDRAANKHRFLIVKRDQDMDDDKTTDLPNPTPPPPAAPAVKFDDGHRARRRADGAREPTGLVELLGSLGADNERLADLASELRAVAEQLLVRPAYEDNSSDVEARAKSEPQRPRASPSSPRRSPPT